MHIKCGTTYKIKIDTHRTVSVYFFISARKKRVMHKRVRSKKKVLTRSGAKKTCFLICVQPKRFHTLIVSATGIPMAKPWFNAETNWDFVSYAFSVSNFLDRYKLKAHVV